MIVSGVGKYPRVDGRGGWGGGDAGSPPSVTTSWGGQPAWDNGFGMSVSECLFVITPTIALLLLKFVQGGGGEMKRYQKAHQRFPLQIPQGPRTELVGKYKELRLDVIHPPARERPTNQWILDKTWKAVDKQVTLRRQGALSNCIAHWMNHDIKPSLATDCKQCMANARIHRRKSLERRSCEGGVVRT